MGNLEWACVPRTLRDGLKWLWRCGVSLYGSSVKGTRRDSSLAGDPGGKVQKALERGIYFHRGPAGEPGSGLIYQGL